MSLINNYLRQRKKDLINVIKKTLFIAFMLTLISYQIGIRESFADSTPIKSDNDLPTFTEAASDNGSQGGFSLDVRGADLRDVLSALAIKMGVNIILLGTEPIEMDFQAKNISPKGAFELIIQSKGLAYVQNGDILIVGTPADLEKDFFSQMILTRFDTYHITTDKVQKMIADLGVQGVKSVLVDTNPHIIWVQGTAEGLEKVHELIANVDVEEVKEKTIEEQQARFVYTLTNVVAADAATRLEKFGFKDIVTIATDGDRYGHELMVICPKKIETEVKTALNNIDGTRKRTRAPVLTAKGTYAHQALASARDLLSEISGVSAGNMNISRNLGPSSEPIHVLWVEETPDKIRMLKDLVTEMKLEEITQGDSDKKDSE
ncbi:hypothetical protein Dred_1041 [Desulforamulus reducens MI-1]|uniref:Uncharacterized protein n=1 Tax=Desulforamulus reducens (strain ATCC BAA-1160 / DSM 100696 / MI-1) TaxID=349161 RepID=A4J3C3_DESRM|nr:hypothetical protein [Desulforamulus reducens]ABO49576.1 hypothetical protein Dred_1041 [Desulforamulus reducens MI-1]